MLHPGKPLEAANGTPIFGGSTHRLAILFDELRAEGKNAGDRLMNARRGPYFTRAFNVLFGQDTQNVNNGVDEDEQTALALRKYFLALKGMRHEEVQVNADLRFCGFCSLRFGEFIRGSDIFHLDCDNDTRWVQKTEDGEMRWKGEQLYHVI
ncbi:uncharacterized protein EAF01_000988 [Botrytis porri]|uniref:uncharacterized protein n=1 Tax=Botrytis porri TaxID=87229 RepID=UPI001901272A|nr:uncharacterized protein EAF01_000988 [Botrytis porri]KAF7914582.1 hypothetical protein EAF01_000988 [Botrytis porri]